MFSNFVFIFLPKRCRLTARRSVIIILTSRTTCDCIQYQINNLSTEGAQMFYASSIYAVNVFVFLTHKFNGSCYPLFFRSLTVVFDLLYFLFATQTTIQKCHQSK